MDGARARVTRRRAGGWRGVTPGTPDIVAAACRRAAGGSDVPGERRPERGAGHEGERT